MTLNESIVEEAALTWFKELGYVVEHGPHLAPGEPATERDSLGEAVLCARLRDAIRRLNPAMPEEAREDAVRKVLLVATPSLTQTNRAFHKMLRDGVPVEYSRPDGSIAGDHARLVNFSEVTANDWLAVNQFTVIEGQHNRRPDIEDNRGRILNFEFSRAENGVKSPFDEPFTKITAISTSVLSLKGES